MSDLKQTSVLLPAELYQWLRGESYRSGLSMSRIITVALLEYRFPEMTRHTPGDTYRPAETGDGSGV